MTQIKWLQNPGVVLAAVLGIASLVVVTTQDRRPASPSNRVQLELKSIELSAAARLRHQDNLYIRVVFDEMTGVSLLRDQTFNLQAGMRKDLSLIVPVEQAWLRQDQVQFRVEIVHAGRFENIVARCAHTAKEVTQFDRILHCTLPGDSSPFLVYRLSNSQFADRVVGALR